MSRLRNSDIAAPGFGERMGDAMMRRFYGDKAPNLGGSLSVDGKASLHIQFDNAPAGMKTSTSADGLFKDVNVSKRRQLAG